MNADSGSLYGIKYWLMWCGKVLAQVVESTLIVWEDLDSSPMYANYVLFDLLLILILCMVMLCDNMIIELWELSWNMIWLSGGVTNWSFVWSCVQTLVNQIELYFC